MSKSQISGFLQDTRGNFAVITAIAAPVMMLLVAGGLDIARYRGTVDEMQGIADFAAISGAREMILANSSQSSIQTTVTEIVASRMGTKFEGKAYTPTVDVRMSENEVYVHIAMQVKGMLGQNLFPEGGMVKADSTAVATSSTQVCAVSLSDQNAETFLVGDSATLNADSCSLYANSTDSEAVLVDKNTTLSADFVCSAGGIVNESRDFTGIAVTDCPEVADPLAARRAPTVPSYCDEVDFVLGALKGNDKKNTDTDVNTGDSGSSPLEKETIRPGVYCGGLHILKKAEVTLEPGTYIIKDGPLEIDKLAEVRGEGVSFYFTGSDAVVLFRKNSDIELSAPTSGLMAGILFMEDRNNASGQQHIISSNRARKLLGTIYLPQGEFLVDSNQPVSREAAYTIVIANEFKLSGMPALYLNTDYSSTTVPVPEGVGPISGSAYLRN